MTTLPSGRAGLFLAVVLLLPAAAVAQPFGEGTHAFRAVLNKANVKPLQSIADVDRDPAHSIIIALGKLGSYEETFCDPVVGLRRFLREGGAVLIATDHHTSPELSRVIGASVNGTFLRAPPGEWCYRNDLIDCPFLEPPTIGLQDAAAFLGVATRDALFAGLRGQVATNRPSFLDSRQFDMPVMARVPAERQFARRELPPGHFPLLDVVAGGPAADGHGRILVMADHSIFINDMMLQPDNDNIPFAVNVVRWLADPGGANRTSALFIEDGQVRTSFDVSLEYQEPPLPPIEALVPLADQALLALEREEVFNRALLRAVGRDTLLRTLLLIVTLGLVGYGLYTVTRSRFRPDPQLPRNTTPAAHAATALALDRRQAAQLRAGDLGEAAHELARQTLADLGASPAVTVAGPWWRRQAWGRRLRNLERVAAEGPWWRVTPRRLVRLAAELDELRQAVAAGTVRFGAPGRSA
jgi:hypothetical protein